MVAEAFRIAPLIETLFSSQVDVTLDCREADPTARFWIVSGKLGQPRWIIPMNARYGLWTLQQWTPYDLLSRLKWRLLLAAYRFGVLGNLPGVYPIGFIARGTANWQDIWRTLGWSKDQSEPIPIIYVGTAGPKQKLVVIAVNPTSQKAEQVMKIPLGPQACEAVLKEARILSELQMFNPSLGPQPLWVNEDTGTSAQAYLFSSPAPVQLTHLHIDWLLKLNNQEQIRESDPLLGLHRRLASGFEACAVPEVDQEPIWKTLGQLSNISQMPVVWEHGDFVSWNIRCFPDGSLVLVDWEESEATGLPMQDLFYFHFIWDFLKDRPSSIPSRISSCNLYRRYMSFFNLDRTDSKNLYRYFQLNFLSRKLLERQSHALARTLKDLGI